MKTSPILFSVPMIRALLEGRKTQTRRVVKPQPALNTTWYGSEFSVCGKDFRCPYGQSGDLLWVRETWAIQDCGKRVSLAPEAWPNGWPVDRLQYCADYPDDTYWWNKRVSIHMPRWASRLTLNIADVRVERVQDISADDCFAEGVQLPVAKDTGGFLLDLMGKYPACNYISKETAAVFMHGDPNSEQDVTIDLVRAYFASLWDSINADRGHSWESNPWVWVIVFEVIQKNVD